MRDALAVVVFVSIEAKPERQAPAIEQKHLSTRHVNCALSFLRAHHRVTFFRCVWGEGSEEKREEREREEGKRERGKTQNTTRAKKRANRKKRATGSCCDE